MLAIGVFKVHCILNTILRYNYKMDTDSSTGFWLDTQRNSHVTSNELSKHLIKFYSKRKALNVLDLGCGNGTYVSDLLEKNIKAHGIDCNNLLIKDKGNENFSNLDLTKRIIIPSDYVQTFEVGEHIPKKYSKIFFENICNNAKKGIIISWAVPGQGGNGHINELPIDDVIKEIEKRGFKLNNYETKEIRNCISSTSFNFIYFKHNLLVFDKYKSKNLL